VRRRVLCSVQQKRRALRAARVETGRWEPSVAACLDEAHREVYRRLIPHPMFRDDGMQGAVRNSFTGFLFL